MRSHMHDRPLFAFDWDDVIANRDRLRSAIRDLFTLAGVSSAVEQESYEAVKKKGGYSFNKHVREILRHDPRLKDSAAALARAFDALLRSMDRLVYPDAERFLLRIYGHFPIAIVTTGDTDFQQRKIAQSGIAQYADHLVCIEHRPELLARDKSRALGQLLEMYPRIFFFEDRAPVVATVHEEHDRHGRIVPIRVDRAMQSSIAYPNIIRHFDEFDLNRWLNLSEQS